MVFSFFKKKAEKMPERVVARPLPSATSQSPIVREGAAAPDVHGLAQASPLGNTLAGQEVSAVPSVAPDFFATPDSLDFSTDDFGDVPVPTDMTLIDAESDSDPLRADIEHAVVLFANAQDDAARNLLAQCIKTYPGVEGRRFWFLLFDLLQIQGDRPAFDQLCVEFAESCEMSPPAWRALASNPRDDLPASQVFALHGVLTAEEQKTMQQLDALLALPGDLQVDFSRLAGCDDELAGQLAGRLSAARQAGKSLRLLGAESFLARLDERLPVGEAKHEASWRLLLELLQRQGTQAHFEERAVDYAITFELSPPSWDSVPPPARVKAQSGSGLKDEAFYLYGSLKNQRFDELLPLLERNGQPVIDFAGVSRMDFYSVGQLVNRLAPFKAAGKDILIRHPNHLVAELMRVVGLEKQVRIIISKS
jgi:anti-anti-sigma regulatory factor